VARNPRDLAARSPEVLVLGFHELRSAESKVRVDAWQSIRWDRVVNGWTRVAWRESQHSVEFSHLGDSRNRRVKARQFNRGGKVARLRVAKSIEEGVNSALTYHVSEDRNREAREFDLQTHEGASCERC
jgi:hypothetical protein